MAEGGLGGVAGGDDGLGVVGGVVGGDDGPWPAAAAASNDCKTSTSDVMAERAFTEKIQMFPGFF